MVSEKVRMGMILVKDCIVLQTIDSIKPCSALIIPRMI